MPFDPQFFVPTTDMKEKINLKEKLQTVDFTILSASFSSTDATSLDLLKETIKAFPKEFVRNLVCVRPDRLIEHEILAQLQAGIQLDKTVEDEADTFGEAFTRVQSLLKATRVEEESSPLYSQTLVAVDALFEDLINGQLIDEYPFLQKELRTLKAFYNETAEKEPWSKDRNLLKAVCTQRGAALVYTNKIRELVAPYVATSINDLCDQGMLHRLNLVAKEEGIAIFTTGGVSSGKGTCLKNISEALKEREPVPIAWNQIVHHNADRLKPFLQNPELDPKKYSQFTYEEALLVKERVMQVIEQQSKQEGKFPHFLHDQTKLKPEELREARRRYREVIITAISTEVSSSIKWAYSRGEQTRRFEHTEGLLGSHQAVPGELIKSLNQNVLIDNDKMSVAMYDNNSPSRELTMFATIDMQSKQIIIDNDEMMQNWIKKENINPKAKPDEALYFEKPTRSTAEYFSPLLEKDFTLTFNGPEIKPNVVDNLKSY